MDCNSIRCDFLNESETKLPLSLQKSYSFINKVPEIEPSSRLTNTHSKTISLDPKVTEMMATRNQPSPFMVKHKSKFHSKLSISSTVQSKGG